MTIQPKKHETTYKTDKEKNNSEYKEHDNVHMITDIVFSFIQDKYKGKRIKNDEEHTYVYIYETDDKKDMDKEIAFISTDRRIILIVMKGILKEKELTDGCLRVLNHLNCGRYFLTHQIDTSRRVYKCRCLVSQETLQDRFDEVMLYVEKEYTKARLLLSMESTTFYGKQ